MLGLSHPRAITRVSDPIHGTIPLTIFDRDFVDRPDFQRLHFVLQQSVNFVAFPSNKNTRFPHSLGTAHTVGRMFSNALSNAGNIDLSAFLNDAADLIERVTGKLYDGQGGGVDTERVVHSAVLEGLSQAHSASISGRSGFLHTPLMPREGKRLAEEPSARIDTEDKVGSNKLMSAAFVIDTYWQALRLYALAHDVGHLPMSHAFEVALQAFTTVSDGYKPQHNGPVASKLYEQARNKYQGKLDEDSLNDFLTSILDVTRARIKASIGQKELHEVRSYAILSSYLKDQQRLTAGYGDFLPITDSKDVPATIGSNWLDEYCRVIHHLALCIIYSYIAHKGRRTTEPTPTRFLYAMRQLVDGQVDGDRLDYTLRDCRSAGANFGEFDLDRVIRDTLLLQRRNEEGNATGVFAFGFGPRAVPGIEQFFESRYQGYRYLVHHRTASRANVTIQLLLQKLFEYAYRYPDSRCASVMWRLGFVDMKEDENGQVALWEILPGGDGDGETLDDASLRVLMKRCRAILRREGNFDQLRDESEERWRRAKQLDTLIELLLFRALEHTETLFKSKTVTSYLTELDIKDRETQINFTKQIAAPDPLIRISREINESLNDGTLADEIGVDEPLLFCAERTAPKCFRAKVLEEHVHEEFTWIADPSGTMQSIDHGQAAPTLKTMEASRQDNLGLRFYLIGRDIKANPNVVQKVEALVNKHILEAFEEFKGWSKKTPKKQSGKKAL